jgi:HSP20 family protein
MEVFTMAETPTKLPVKTEEKAGRASAPDIWRPFEGLRQEVDRLFEDFGRGFWRAPFRRSLFDLDPAWRRETTWAASPAVDIAEKDKEYEITAELPGLDESNIEVKVAGDMLTIKGEKQAEKEEKQKDYYLAERSYGAFERSFRMPDGVDAEKIAAEFKKGVLTVTLPKTAEAQKQEKKIAVKAA